MPLAPPMGNREVMHKMTIPLHSRFVFKRFMKGMVINMIQKQLFSIWAPNEGQAWTKFTKPALFVHTENVQATRINATYVPLDVRDYVNKNTAIIVNLPGASGVEVGLGLARAGSRPVPLYNGIHEPQNGGLASVVDNTKIIEALVSGAEVLDSTSISETAPPAFLLDSNRNIDLNENHAMYDNRYSIGSDDMPTADYMKSQGISQIFVWCNTLQGDLKSILIDYHNAGIAVMTYIDGSVIFENENTLGLSTATPAIPKAVSDAVRNFENARFGLLLITLLAGFNLIGMFLVLGQPFLWTAPTIMWLTYLWVPEIVGDIIALLLVGAYIALYFASYKKHKLIIAATVLFAVEVAVLFVYALSYGLVDYVGGSFWYGVVVFAGPVFLLYLLSKGAPACKKVGEIGDNEYLDALDYIDGISDGGHRGNNLFRVPRRRRIFRPYRSANYRGYSGYGGTGRGGYGGSGYGGGYGGFGG